MLFCAIKEIFMCFVLTNVKTRALICMETPAQLLPVEARMTAHDIDQSELSEPFIS